MIFCVKLSNCRIYLYIGNYIDEAQHQKRYRALITADPVLSRLMSVPRVFENLSTAEVLVTEFVPGRAIDHALTYPQDVRNVIGRAVLIATVKELFEWRFVQSDPNFANFLYDHPSRMIHCIDFGASREYSPEFVDQYLELVWAAANKDHEKILAVSKDIGFLSGDESREMVEAHLQTGLLMGEPFQSNEPYDFAHCHITKRASKHGEVFMTHRLKAPPAETYSLHRKLAGAFLLCIRLKATIRCRDILEDAYKKHTSDKSKSGI